LKLVGLSMAVAVVALAIVVRVYELTALQEREFTRDVMTPEEARHVTSAAKQTPNRRERRRAAS
jgi:hypothetical protein